MEEPASLASDDKQSVEHASMPLLLPMPPGASQEDGGTSQATLAAQDENTLAQAWAEFDEVADLVEKQPSVYVYSRGNIFKEIVIIKNTEGTSIDTSASKKMALLLFLEDDNFNHLVTFKDCCDKHNTLEKEKKDRNHFVDDKHRISYVS